MKRADRVTGVILAILAAYCFFEAFRGWTGWEGSMTMILFIAVLSGFVSLVMILRPPSEETAHIELPSKASVARIGKIGLLFGLYIGLMDTIGYPLGTWLFLAGASRSMLKRPLHITLIWSAAISVGSYIILKRYLGAPLSGGFIGF